MMRSSKMFWFIFLSLSLISFPRGGSLLFASQSPSHATHFFSDKGPHILLNKIGCYTCHADGRLQCQVAPAFADGTEEVPVFLETTTVCDGCHSAGGMLDGVAMAKLNWDEGVHEAGGTALKSGKEMWCISCHDAGTSVCDGVSAPDISGDNSTYGYYVNGHRSRLCSDCHDLTITHIDGEARTYAFNLADYAPGESGVSYAASYRLKSMGEDDPETDYDESVPLMIPTNYGTTFGYAGQDMLDNAFRLCFSCHDSTEILDDTPGEGVDTNFKSAMPNPPRDYSYSLGESNQHVLHVMQTMQAWDSDWDDATTGPGPGPGYDSLMTCSSCHNVHGAAWTEGSTNEPMIRDGSLAGREPGYGFSYVIEDLVLSYPYVTSDGASLPISIGAVLRNGNALCSGNCHQPTPPGPPGSGYDASGSGSGTYLEYYRAVGTFNCSDCHAYGTEASHPTHDVSTGKGVDLDCYVCHDSWGHVNNSIDFDDQKPLSTTEACDDCHSPGGAFNGVSDPDIGAKANWEQGIYDEAGISLSEGKEGWCAVCHDDDPDTLGTNESALIDGVHAPGIVGDGITYGFYASGHGRSESVECLDCHTVTFAHIDGEARTYEAASDNYQEGYRLNTSMRIPRIGGGAGESDFALCYKGCHHIYDDQSRFYTNFKEALWRPARNWHEEHLQSLFTGPEGQVWDSDWDSEHCGMSEGGLCADSAMSCPACHNVHGSPMDIDGVYYSNPVMIRHGELISTPGTNDKVPAFDFHWYDEGNDMTAELDASRRGGLLCGYTKYLDYNHVCYGCHSTGEITYSRTPGAGEGVITHQVWTTDLNNNPLTTFSPGDGIRYHVSFTVFGHPEYPDYVYYVKTKASGAQSSDYPEAADGSWRHVLNRDAYLTENADADPYVWTWDRTIPTDSNAVSALLSVKIELYGGGSDPWDKGNREESNFTIE